MIESSLRLSIFTIFFLVEYVKVIHIAMMLVELRNILVGIMGRNSDPNGKSLRAGDPIHELDWDLRSNPMLVNTVAEHVKKPIHSEYLRIFTDRKIPRSYVEASRKIDQILDIQSEIPLSVLPVNLRCVDLSDPKEVSFFHDILNVSSNSWYAARCDQQMKALTSGKFSKIHCYRIMKCASTTMFSALQDAFVGEELRRCYLPTNQFSGDSERCGYIGKRGTVSFSWSPLGCVTKSFNFSHSHFPVTSFNKYPKSVYKVISMRDPLSRIVSIFNMFRIKFDSVDEFVEHCHPDYIFGQLYFLDQKLSLNGAKRTLQQLNRVLIVEESKNWSDQLSSDLGTHVPIVARNKGRYDKDKESSAELHKRLEKLISKQPRLAGLLEKEYKLYDFARTL